MSVPSARLPRLLRSEPRSRVDRGAVPLHLEMHVRAGRHSALTQRADDEAGGHSLAVDPADGRQMTVEDANVRVDRHNHILAGAGRIETNMGGPCARRVHGSPQRRGEVYPGVNMPSGAERVVRLEVEAGTAEGLGDHGIHHNAGERQPSVGRDSPGTNDPDRGCARDDRCDTRDADHALTSACSMCVNASWTVDCSLCATFSVPPSAPGTLKTINSAARANR